MVGSRKMGDNLQTRKYAYGMGVTGYQTAAEIFMQKLRQNSVDAVLTIANNFEDISEIIRELTSGQRFKRVLAKTIN